MSSLTHHALVPSSFPCIPCSSSPFSSLLPPPPCHPIFLTCSLSLYLPFSPTPIPLLSIPSHPSHLLVLFLNTVTPQLSSPPSLLPVVEECNSDKGHVLLLAFYKAAYQTIIPTRHQLAIGRKERPSKQNWWGKKQLSSDEKKTSAKLEG